MFKFLEQIAPISSRIKRLMIRNLYAKAHETYASYIATPGYIAPTCTPRSKVDELGKLFFWGPTHLVETGVSPAAMTTNACSSSTVPFSAIGYTAPPDRSVPVDSVLFAKESQALSNAASMDLTPAPVDTGLHMQTFEHIFGVQPGSWDPGPSETQHLAQNMDPHTAYFRKPRNR
ncbi:hypothetical protein AURDEDRAFT_169069 [Auricularia subglabra TFB-10046 SS5]|nr:hypothetical protein AURDEDRAFT_169069 [Auricularia subglabra TFB-10046 SS5]